MSASGPLFKFLADAIGLHFLNALAYRSNGTCGAIAHGETFLRWFKESELIPNDALQKLRTSALPGEMDTIAAQARVLGDGSRFCTELQGQSSSRQRHRSERRQLPTQPQCIRSNLSAARESDLSSAIL
jgi:hypothetical protein